MFHLGYSKYLVKSVYLEGLLGYLFGLLQYLRERDLDLVFRSYFSPALVTKNNTSLLEMYLLSLQNFKMQEKLIIELHPF